ncbi:hypothetical protein [Mycobacterium sp. 1245801.1]|uniref:hypothetical protein n=1 Tax=Mycobacterium sp. 1245801.1 TaxID=1834075 RepID=UPI0007FDCDCA|nr:hypothetical protein [Mycobacterium sp. 1245801.1]OBJ19881.1 hypothetical protein A5622_20175 [Mycobacterium sp. 1245801.1]
MTMLDLTLVEDIAGRHIGRVLLTWTDIESVRTVHGLGRYRKTEIGSMIRTRSGDTHFVAERVDFIKAAMDKCAAYDGGA